MRLLFLAPFAPRRDGTHGGSRAVAELLVRLTERHRVALLHLRGPKEAPADGTLFERCESVREVARTTPAGALGRFGRRVRVAGALARGTPAVIAGSANEEFAAAVQDVAHGWRPDIVQLEYHLMGTYLPALAHCPAPRVLRQYEPGAATARDRSAHRSGLARFAGALEERAWERFERGVMARVRVVVALTARDLASLKPLAGGTPIEVIPLGVSPPARAFNAAGEGAELLFVGNFAHPPNIESVERLIRDIFPRVRAQCSDAVLRIVGVNPQAHWHGLEAAGVLVTGHVPDVGPFLDRAAVVLAPLSIGGGMRVKVMEALAGGKAVVATPLALEGLKVEDGDQVRIGRTDDELVQATLELLQHPDRRASMGRRARTWVIAELGWDRPVAAFERLYESLLPKRPHTPAQPSAEGSGRC
jgi:glycosyltransferase involved in cell wall biosynthesis